MNIQQDPINRFWLPILLFPCILFWFESRWENWFEVLDDIHIVLANGSIELLQTKHTIQKKSKREIR
jgi:hypothetical protein